MSDTNTIPTTPTPRHGLHPILWVAASAVTVFALAGTAYVTGLLPRHDASAPVTPPVAVAPTPIASVPTVSAPPAPTPTAPQASVAPRKPASRTTVVRSNEQNYSSRPRSQDEEAARSVDNGQSYTSRPAVCAECGTIESVRSVVKEGDGSGLGAVAGGVVGGALGNGVGQGTGRSIATIAGAIGGAVLGNKIEKNQRQTVSYQTTVRFEDGTSRTFVSDHETGWQAGDRVKVTNGQITPR